MKNDSSLEASCGQEREKWGAENVFLEDRISVRDGKSVLEMDGGGGCVTSCERLILLNYTLNC